MQHRDKYDQELIRWAKGHYWDSLEEYRDLILRHLRTFAEINPDVLGRKIEIRFAWVCRNIKFNEIERVELTDERLLSGDRPSWITSDNCEIIAKILPTGKPDCKGIEIFEGDILKIVVHMMAGYDQYGNDLYEPETVYSPVVFKAGTFGIKLAPWGDCDHINWRELGDDDTVEIIGNIYENPELLK